MAVPLLNIKQQNAPFENELKAAASRVIETGQFILGPEVDRFERAVEAYTGARHALGVSSGTDAILLALMALDIGPGDEVIVPTFTFFATGGCVSRVGATPVFVDICPVSYNLSVEEVAKKITDKTKAIIPVHLYGQCADMEELQTLADQHGLVIIEDAAQALGACYKGKFAGAIGEFGCYSFYPTKNLGGYGDSGMLVTNSDELAKKAKLLRIHGMERQYYHEKVGGNFRMDGFQGALLNVKLPHLDSYNEARNRIATRYRNELGEIDGAISSNKAACTDEEGNFRGYDEYRLVLPTVYGHVKHIWHQFTILVPGKKRDELKAYLQEREIASGVYYPLTLDRQECFADTPSANDAYPIAHTVAETCLCLPIYPEMTQDQQSEVIAAIKSFFASY